MLIAKRYILGFDSGVVVVKHWLINNTIRKDRSLPTTYKLELQQITYNEFGAYTERRKIKTPLIKEQRSKKLSKAKPENDNQMSPQIRLDKIRIDYINTTNVVLASRRGKPEINEMFDFWEQHVGYPITSKLKPNRNACNNLIKKHKVEGVQRLILGVVQAHDDRYAPRISDFVDLQSKLNQLMVWGKGKSKKGAIIVWNMI